MVIPSSPPPSPGQMQGYLATARKRQQQQQAQLAQRRQQGLSLAQVAAQTLRQRFELDRLVLFGSVLDPDTFHAGSDLDIAVWGLPRDDYFRAVACLLDLAATSATSDPFDIDLVEAEFASDYIQAAIAQGIDL
jgi:predicted nucleotidyltransferase